MTQNVLLHEPKDTSFRPLTQLIFTIAVGVFLALIAGFFAILTLNQSNTDRIVPGVNVGGVDLSDLTMGEALVKLNADLAYPNKGQIILTDGQNQWAYTPEQLGLSLNTIASIDQAFRVGRQSNLLNNLSTQLNVRQNGLKIEPEIVYDQRQAYARLQEIARWLDKPVVEAAINLEGTQVTVTPGQIGYSLNILQTLKPLEQLLFSRQDGVVSLVIDQAQPLIMDVSETAAQTQAILSQPLTLTMPDGETGMGPWTIEPQDLARLLVIQRSTDSANAGFEVSLNQAGLSNFLSGLAPALSRDPVNARMTYEPATDTFTVLENAVIGRALDIEESLKAVTEKLPGGEHTIALVMKTVDPAVKDDTTPESLGIRELVFEDSSYFYGSANARLQNIGAASSEFHGIFVPPGAVFSMADYLTDISLENGYAEALIIVGNQTVTGVGGGVCQVSTTLFRTVFFAGFPIVERHAHAYRVGYYEQQSNGWSDTNLAGLDATVYVPLVDFKFQNDTPNWLLMETYLNGYSLNWKIYGTSDGRSVDWTTTGVTNVTEPPDPIYSEDPDLAEGEIEQVDWAVQGASVSVNRTVYRDRQVYFNDTFNTNYVAWPDQFIYGPGTDISEYVN